MQYRYVPVVWHIAPTKTKTAARSSGDFSRSTFAAPPRPWCSRELPRLRIAMDGADEESKTAGSLKPSAAAAHSVFDASCCLNVGARATAASASVRSTSGSVRSSFAHAHMQFATFCA